MSQASEDHQTAQTGDRSTALLEVMRSAGSLGDRARVTSLTQLEGGFSRHSWVARVEDPDQPEAGERAYVVRVKPHGSVLETSIEQEFRTYEVLADEPLPTPRVHGFEPVDSPFGGPFFVMDMLPGKSVNVWRRRDRELLEADWSGDRGLAEDFVRYLAAIHAVGADRLDGLVEARDFRQAVEHWQDIWESVRLLRDPVIDEAYAWVLDREPPPVEPCLVHSDYRIGNCLMQDGRLTGVLDWELSFVGDPRFDLGYMSLDYHAGKFTSPGSQLLASVADHDWFYDRYEQLTGQPVDREAVRTFAALGALMLFAIMSTGIKVYADNRSTDVRMVWARFTFPGIRQDLAGLMGWRGATGSSASGR